MDFSDQADVEQEQDPTKTFAHHPQGRHLSSNIRLFLDTSAILLLEIIFMKSPSDVKHGRAALLSPGYHCTELAGLSPGTKLFRSNDLGGSGILIPWQGKSLNTKIAQKYPCMARRK